MSTENRYHHSNLLKGLFLGVRISLLLFSLEAHYSTVEWPQGSQGGFNQHGGTQYYSVNNSSIECYNNYLKIHSRRNNPNKVSRSKDPLKNECPCFLVPILKLKLRAGNIFFFITCQNVSWWKLYQVSFVTGCVDAYYQKRTSALQLNFLKCSQHKEEMWTLVWPLVKPPHVFITQQQGRGSPLVCTHTHIRLHTTPHPWPTGPTHPPKSVSVM